MEKYIIDDIQCKRNASDELKEEFGLQVLDAKSMTGNLLSLKMWSNLDPNSTMIIMPGNGASIVKKYIENLDSNWLEKWPWKFYPKAKRVWKPGEDPRTYVERADCNKMILGLENVVIIDDVISSGSTIKNLRRINAPWIPKARWSAAAWVMQKTASTKGFTGGVAAIKAVGSDRRVPINSLSTLVECPDIAKSYAERNFGKAKNQFLTVIKKLF